MVQRITLKNGTHIYVDESGEQINVYGESPLTKIKLNFVNDNEVYWAVVKAMSKIKDIGPIFLCSTPSLKFNDQKT